MTYTVEVAPAAGRQIRKLGREVQGRIVAALEKLANEPRPPGVTRLHGHEDFYRIRVGDYRIVYHIEDEHWVVLVVKVGHRGDIYRKR